MLAKVSFYGGAKSLSISMLKKSGLLVDKVSYKGSISYGDGETVLLRLDWTGDGYRLNLAYTYEDYEAVRYDINYSVQFVYMPSNLGKGGYYLFRCPISGKPVRSLIIANGSHYFKARSSYKAKLYYRSQLISKRGRFNAYFWYLEEKIDALYRTRIHYTYKGKETKRARRLRLLEERQEVVNEYRYNSLLNLLNRRFR